jgi:hypothetical protein
MGIRYFIVTIDKSIPWSFPSPHAPISIRLSFYRPEPISDTRDVVDDLPFDGHGENISVKSAGDTNLSMYFNSRGPLPKDEPRLSLLYVVTMSIILSVIMHCLQFP